MARAHLLSARFRACRLSPHRCVFSTLARRQRSGLQFSTQARYDDHGGASPPPTPPRKTGHSEEGDSNNEFELWRLVKIAASALVILHMAQTPASAVESLPDDALPETDPAKLKLGGPSEGMKDDIETIRRLLRDLFMEQLVLRKRLEAMDIHAQPVSSLFDAAAASALRRRWYFMDRASSDAKVTFSHNLEIQGGYLHAAADDQTLLSSLHRGPRLHSCMLSSIDTDTHVSARTIASATGIRLWQVQLKRVLWDKLTVILSPIGARFKDVAQSLHGSQGAMFPWQYRSLVC
jgi:hypothetical protein